MNRRAEATMATLQKKKKEKKKKRKTEQQLREPLWCSLTSPEVQEATGQSGKTGEIVRGRW